MSEQTHIKGIKLEDLQSADISTRLQAYRTFADNERILRGRVSPKLEEILRCLEEKEKSEVGRSGDM